MTIELYQYRSAPGFPNLSPFCMKVETWLRLAQLPYDIVWQMAPTKGPMGKLPLVRDDGVLIADSHSIIETLATKYDRDLDAGLDARQKAAARAFERLINEHFYWALVYARWIEADTWPQTRAIYFAPLPAPLRPLVGFLARRGIRKDLAGHGLGRHPRDEVRRRGAQDLQALADWLGEQPYFMGEEPTALDASAYAFLANAGAAPVKSALNAMIDHHPNLLAYCERMRLRCFPELSS